MATQTKTSTRKPRGIQIATQGTRKPRQAKPKATVVYCAPADPTMMGLSKIQLVEHGRKGEAECEQAALEMFRRADNAMRRKAAEAKS